MTAIALTVISLLVLAANGDSWSGKPRPRWLPRIWWSIGMCETGLDWHFANSSYVTAFGIYRPAWASFRSSHEPAVPEQATPQQQLAVARAIWRRYGFSGWGCYTHGGYLYWLRVAP